MRTCSVLVLALFVAGCGQSDQSAPEATSVSDGGTSTETGIALPPATASLVRLTMPGMTWSGCCASVKKALRSLPGVTTVETDADTTTATLTVVPGEFDAQAAVDAVEQASYPATQFEDISPVADEVATEASSESSEGTGSPEEATAEETTSEGSATTEETESTEDAAEKPAAEETTSDEPAPKEETETVVE